MPTAAAASVAAWRIPDPDWLLPVDVRTGYRRRYEAHRAQVEAMTSALDNGLPHPGMHRAGRRDQYRREQIKADNSKLVKSILDIAKKSYDRQVRLYNHGTLDKSQTARGSKGFQDRTRSMQTQTTGNAFSVQSQNEPLRRETQRALNMDNARLVRRLMKAKPSPEISRANLINDFEKSRGYLGLARKLRMDLPNPAERVLDYDASQRLKRRYENREKGKAAPKDLPPIARNGDDPAATAPGTEKRVTELVNTPRIAEEMAGLLGDDEELRDIMATLGTSNGADPADPPPAVKQVQAPKGKPPPGGNGRPAAKTKPEFSGTSEGFHPAPQSSQQAESPSRAPEQIAEPSPKSAERPGSVKSAERPGSMKSAERPASTKSADRPPPAKEDRPLPTDGREGPSSKPSSAEIAAQVTTDIVFKDIVPLSFSDGFPADRSEAEPPAEKDAGVEVSDDGSVDLAVNVMPTMSPQGKSDYSFEEDFDEYVESVGSADN